MFNVLCLLGFFFYPEDGGSTVLRNVCKRLPDCTSLYSRRQLQEWKLRVQITDTSHGPNAFLRASDEHFAKCKLKQNILRTNIVGKQHGLLDGVLSAIQFPYSFWSFARPTIPS
jgi:hypothetical protein